MNKQKTYTVKVSENTMKKMEEYFEDKKRLKTPNNSRPDVSGRQNSRVACANAHKSGD